MTDYTLLKLIMSILGYQQHVSSFFEVDDCSFKESLAIKLLIFFLVERLTSFTRILSIFMFIVTIKSVKKIRTIVSNVISENKSVTIHVWWIATWLYFMLSNQHRITFSFVMNASNWLPYFDYNVIISQKGVENGKIFKNNKCAYIITVISNSIYYYRGMWWIRYQKWVFYFYEC